MRDESEAIQAIERYSDLVKRICFLYLKNQADTEDIFQTVFLKYILYSGIFESAGHEKAWMVRVTINACKDLLKSFYHKRMLPLDMLKEEASKEPESHGLLEVVLGLPKKYKDVIYLFYYEEYSAAEIAGIIGKKENTVYTLLARGRAMLKEKIGGDGFEG